MVDSEEEKRTCKMKEYGVFLFVDDFDFINCPSPGWSPSCSPTPCSTECDLIGLYCAAPTITSMLDIVSQSLYALDCPHIWL